MIGANRIAIRKRRTKIVATLGPASLMPGVIEQLVTAGVDVFRLNFSHGTHEMHAEAYAAVRAASAKAGLHVAVLADLCGPKIRVGRFADGPITLIEGTEVVVTVREVSGTATLIPSSITRCTSTWCRLPAVAR